MGVWLHRFIDNPRAQDETKQKLLPTQHPQNEIEDEKGAEDDERDKIDPRQLIAHSVLHLRDGQRDRKRVEEEGRGEG